MRRRGCCILLGMHSWCFPVKKRVSEAKQKMTWQGWCCHLPQAFHPLLFGLPFTYTLPSTLTHLVYFVCLHFLLLPRFSIHSWHGPFAQVLTQDGDWGGPILFMAAMSGGGFRTGVCRHLGLLVGSWGVWMVIVDGVCEVRAWEWIDDMAMLDLGCQS